MIRLYNTMNRQIEDFEPISDGEVTIYTCGPTVYDFPHIGNWYAFLRWDLLVRVLRASGYKTKWVMNITDVGHLTSDSDEGEDKLEKGARREHKTAQEVAKEYSDYFVRGLKRLNFVQPSSLPRATDHISEQIEFIKNLEDKNFTYTIDDGVYFDTSKDNEYGKLAKLNIEELKVGARVQANPQKRNPTDFALWKFSPKDKKRDMEWPSPWGKGFPGWHLECSTFIKNCFDVPTIDIHSGGIDHIPVHHTNEIAQSEAVNQKPLANYWVHSNFVKVDNQKMSKSLGNLITLEDIEAKGFSLEAFRLLVFESHYRSEAQFSWGTMQAAQNRLNSYKTMGEIYWQNIVPDYSQNADLTPLNSGSIIQDYENIVTSLQNDLNSPEALSSLSSIATQINERFVEESAKEDLRKFLISIDNILGFKLSESKDITDGQKQLIKEREDAREAKDWAKSDEIRDRLKEQGIELRDTQYGAIWSRI